MIVPCLAMFRVVATRVGATSVCATVADLSGQADAAVAAGVREDGLLIDSAQDFGKNTYRSFQVTGQLSTLVETGWLVLLVVSRCRPDPTGAGHGCRSAQRRTSIGQAGTRPGISPIRGVWQPCHCPRGR